LDPVKELDSYLNDHLAGSIGAIELIAHWAKLYQGEPLGAFFTDLESEIKADQDRLRDLMRCIGVEESKVRQAGAWAAEKLGLARFVVAGDEPDGLGLVLVLEGLIMGITGKQLLWRALDAANLPKAEGFDFKELQRRAREQIERIEAERIRAARRAFPDPVG
jgi:hypothetical protein